MDETLKKKINLLVHLAKSDGKFHTAEREFLDSLLMERGVTNYDLDKVKVDHNFSVFTSTLDKQELLHWSLQLIKADGIIHADEIAYCKALALKLKFNPSVIDHFANLVMPDFKIFKETVRKFVI